VTTLRRLGYRVIGIPSGFDHVAERNFDDYDDTGELTEFEFAALRSSAVGKAVRDEVDDAWLAAVADRARVSLDRLAALSREPSRVPRAVFVHLPLPHLPYAVDASCSVLSPSDAISLGPRTGGGTEETIRLQADQTRCIDRELVEAMRLVVSADPDAIVILMSDHGPDELLDWAAPDQPGIRDRLVNLFAARTPHQDRPFPDDITLVNVVPILFNAYFGTHLPLRSNETYMVTSLSDGVLQPSGDR
jgi:hypothetical protein